MFSTLSSKTQLLPSQETQILPPPPPISCPGVSLNASIFLNKAAMGSSPRHTLPRFQVPCVQASCIVLENNQGAQGCSRLSPSEPFHSQSSRSFQVGQQTSCTLMTTAICLHLSQPISAPSCCCTCLARELTGLELSRANVPDPTLFEVLALLKKH